MTWKLGKRCILKDCVSRSTTDGDSAATSGRLMIVYVLINPSTLLHDRTFTRSLSIPSPITARYVTPLPSSSRKIFLRDALPISFDIPGAIKRQCAIVSELIPTRRALFEVEEGDVCIVSVVRQEKLAVVSIHPWGADNMVASGWGPEMCTCGVAGDTEPRSLPRYGVQSAEIRCIGGKREVGNCYRGRQILATMNGQ